MNLWDAEPGVIELLDGRRVRGAARRVSRARDIPEPDFAVLIGSRRPRTTGRYECAWIRWHDFWVPASSGEALPILYEAYVRARDQRVEIACRGGRGRTGCALALLGVLSGIPPEEAVDWVRSVYHPRAVETRRQQRWVREAGRALLGDGDLT